MPDTDHRITDENLPSVEPSIDGLCQMVRSMLAMSRNLPTGITPEIGIPNRVVFDIEVDGSRYLLIKTMQVNHRGTALSPREREIVRMVALGHPNKVIATVLNISMWTVCTHLRRVFNKLDVTSRAAMVAKVSEVGIESTPPNEWRKRSAEPSVTRGSGRNAVSTVES